MKISHITVKSCFENEQKQAGLLKLNSPLAVAVTSGREGIYRKKKEFHNFKRVACKIMELKKFQGFFVEM